MRRVAEIIHVVESERKAFLDNALNMDKETKKAIWECGVRNQHYFYLNDLIFMTFEYAGQDFAKDMQKMAAIQESKGALVTKRRKDVPPAERDTTNWWVPVKRIATLFDDAEEFNDVTLREQYSEMIGGGMVDPDSDDYRDISYDEGDWVGDIYI